MPIIKIEKITAIGRRYLSLSVVVLLSISGCVAVPTSDMKFEAQSDPRVDFSAYKSFGWLSVSQSLNDPDKKLAAPKFDAIEEIKILVEKELQTKGMLKETVNPDVYIGLELGINMDSTQLKTDPERSLYVLENIPKGALVIAMVDRVTGFVVWIGVVSADVAKSPDSDTAKQRLNYAVSSLLNRFP